MILEQATLIITANKEQAFEQAFKQAIEYVKQSPGFIKHELLQSIESSNRYVLNIHWQKIEDHTVTFRHSELCEKWRELVMPFFEEGTEIFHYRME